MADVNTWQEEVAGLDKCIAWRDALDLRAEVAQQTATMEEQLPKELAEVRITADCFHSLLAAQRREAFV